MNVCRASIVIALALAIVEPRLAAAQVAADSRSGGAGDGRQTATLPAGQMAGGVRAVRARQQRRPRPHARALHGPLRGPARGSDRRAPPLSRGRPRAARRGRAAAVSHRSRRGPRGAALDRAPRVSVLKISVAGVPEGRARVVVDGAEVPAAEARGRRRGPVSTSSKPRCRAAGRRGAPSRPSPDTRSDHAGATTACSCSLCPLPPPRPREPNLPVPNLLVPAGVTFGAGGLAARRHRHRRDLAPPRRAALRCNPSGHCLAAGAAAASAGHFAGASRGLLVGEAWRSRPESPWSPSTRARASSTRSRARRWI